jgi:hypothetical protein
MADLPPSPLVPLPQGEGKAWACAVLPFALREKGPGDEGQTKTPSSNRARGRFVSDYRVGTWKSASNGSPSTSRNVNVMGMSIG